MVSCFGFGLIVLYAAVCLVMPAFGAVSSYGAASVLGVPFLLALLDTGDRSSLPPPCPSSAPWAT